MLRFFKSILFSYNLCMLWYQIKFDERFSGVAMEPHSYYETLWQPDFKTRPLKSFPSVFIIFWLPQWGLGCPQSILYSVHIQCHSMSILFTFMNYHIRQIDSKHYKYICIHFILLRPFSHRRFAAFPSLVLELLIPILLPVQTLLLWTCDSPMQPESHES